jgi:hypothetical protein
MLFFGLIFIGMILIATNSKSRSVVTDLEADIWPVEDFDEADEYNLKNKRLIYVNGKKKVGKAEWEKYSDQNTKFVVDIYSTELVECDVYLNGFNLGTAKKDVKSFKLNLKSELGDKVPEINNGDVITLVANGREVYKARFLPDRD